MSLRRGVGGRGVWEEVQLMCFMGAQDSQDP